MSIRSRRLSKEELAKLESRRMECFNCHNAVGHPFPNPADRVDEALAAGQIDRALPGAKSRAVALINAAGDLSGPMAERTAAVDKLIAADAAKSPVAADLKDKESAVPERMKDILLSTSFEEKGVTWQSFPNHAQHRDSPGCFRCHDGKHLNEKGESIRLQCTLCHNLPQVKLESGDGSVPSSSRGSLAAPSQPQRTELHARASLQARRHPAQCATARSSSGARAAASAPTRPVTVAAGRQST